ncbi:hypothetical protein NM688_g6681 [Phlebia brevispora]|uniref:Uncharacterized protein n=1 Tax=Phlebia brevispora TaxID=194682 RepID=A0ACC1SE02_9APHY|nr:hypothetical protein NM688_g6681 [Phlebia brevispora]
MGAIAPRILHVARLLCSLLLVVIDELSMVSFVKASTNLACREIWNNTYRDIYERGPTTSAAVPEAEDFEEIPIDEEMNVEDVAPSSEPAGPSNEGIPHSDIPEPHQIFEGDMFGSAADYSMNDFPGLEPEDIIMQGNMSSAGTHYSSIEYSETGPLEHPTSDSDLSESESDSDNSTNSEPHIEHIELDSVYTSGSDSDFEDSELEPDLDDQESIINDDSDSNEDDDDVIDSETLAQAQAAPHQASSTQLHDRRQTIEETLRQPIERVHYPSATAGAAVHQALPAHEAYQQKLADDNTLYLPFKSQMDYAFAQWAKQRGPSATALNELLNISGFSQLLGLSYKNVRELNQLVDALPASWPVFKHGEIFLGKEVFDIYYRDIIECIRALYGNPEFAQYLIFTPEKHYVKGSDGRYYRLYHDLHTGKWWWKVQGEIEAENPGATIIPVIISSDKTQVTLFGNKSVYPVYLTIGNLPKDIRRKPSRQGHILLGYIPVTKLSGISEIAARRRAMLNLTHAALHMMTAPLIKAGKEGIEIASGDGVIRRGHSIVAAHVGDYLEQIAIAGVKFGECPRCTVPSDQLGEMNLGYPRLIKHLVNWLEAFFPDDELNARCKKLPRNHYVRHFFNGITHLSQITGREHAHIARIILGLIIDMPMPAHIEEPQRLYKAVRGLLDFLYLAQYSAHTSASLESMQEALKQFHANKAIFEDLGVRNRFNLPKLHWAEHYLDSIMDLGTTDNFNTEYTERLHIDYAKDAYRATNHKEEMAQMTTWLVRKEKMLRLEQHIKWKLSQQKKYDKADTKSHAESNIPSTQAVVDTTKSHSQPPRIQMTKFPSQQAVTFQQLETNYGAHNFEQKLAEYIVKHQNPHASAAEIEESVDSVPTYRIPHVAVHHKAHFWLGDPSATSTHEYDVVHVHPAQFDHRGRPVAGRYDPVIVNDSTGAYIGIQAFACCSTKLF